MIEASGIHVGAMNFVKMVGDASDKNVACLLQDDVAGGLHCPLVWQGMKRLRCPTKKSKYGHGFDW